MDSAEERWEVIDVDQLKDIDLPEKPQEKDGDDDNEHKRQRTVSFSPLTTHDNQSDLPLSTLDGRLLPPPPSIHRQVLQLGHQQSGTSLGTGQPPPPPVEDSRDMLPLQHRPVPPPPPPPPPSQAGHQYFPPPPPANGMTQHPQMNHYPMPQYQQAHFQQAYVDHAGQVFACPYVYYQ